MPNENLPDDDKNATSGERTYYSKVGTLIRQIIVKLPKPNNTAQKAAQYIRSAFQNIAKWLKQPRAWVELLTLCAVGYYANLTHQLVGISTEQLELSERPWIAEEISKASYLTFSNKYGSMYVNISLRNIGKSVAVNVHPFCKLGALKYGHGTIATFEDKACGTLREQTERDPTAGYIMFPDESQSEVNGVAVSQKEIADTVIANSATMKSDMHGLFEPLLVCCVDYRFAFEKKHHQTRRVFTMGIPQPQFPGSWKGLLPKGIVANAVLMPSFQGNSAN